MRMRLLLTLFVGIFFMPKAALCAPFDYPVTVGAGEEYNSNVNERNKAKADWLSVLTAAGNASYESSYIKADAKADVSYNFYMLGNRRDELKGSAQVKATGTIIKELLFVEGEEQFQQVYTNIARGDTNPTDSTRDQVHQNTVIGRAYLTPRINDRLAVKFGYQFTNVFYNKSELDKRVHGVFVQSQYDLTPTVQMLFDSEASRQDSKTAWIERVVVGGGVRWEYSKDGFVLVKAGPRFVRYNDRDFVAEPYWDAKLVHNFGKFQATVDTSSLYVENPSAKYSSRKTGGSAALSWQQDRISLQARGAYYHLASRDTPTSEQVSFALTGG